MRGSRSSWVGRRFGALTVSEERGEMLRCICLCGRVSVVHRKLIVKPDHPRSCERCILDEALEDPRAKTPEDITGQREGLLVAVEPALRRWWFKCDCGKDITGTADRFRSHALRSCGCIGNAHTSWRMMIARCTNPNHNRYHRYGGRGIKLCKRWLDSFSNFLKDMGECPKGHTISRKNADGNYSKFNCTWELHEENTADTRNGVPIRGGKSDVHSHVS